MERTGIVTMHGKPLTLVGPDIKAGYVAPDFAAIDKEMNVVRLSDYPGKFKLISVTPSLDTPVCDLQLRRFNSEAAGLPHDVVVMNISMDLPFAIGRFCAAAGIERVATLSDHKDASFGTAFGVLIKETRLLARSIFILDRDNVVRYAEIVPDLSNHPDYEKALRALRSLMEKMQKAA